MTNNQHQHQNKLICGDSSIELKKLETDSIDTIITDPPYGYSFMGKDWDKAVVDVATWKECLRILKPGAFAFVMSAPRQDVLSHMITNLSDAGFVMTHTPIFWTYISGFPKGQNISKHVDKRMGVEPIKIRKKDRKQNDFSDSQYKEQGSMMLTLKKSKKIDTYYTKPNSDKAKSLDGAYSGYQPKPAVEVIIVAMKPITENSYLDQAMANGHGVTWLDNVRIPARGKSLGKYPSNLIVSDDALDTHSKWFDLDAWNNTHTAEFIIEPKPTQYEKRQGLSEKNFHPTIKPLSLMAYLVKLGSREQDVILDPFMGSGTTIVASIKHHRNYIGIEQQQKYVDIAKDRIKNNTNKQKVENYFG